MTESTPPAPVSDPYESAWRELEAHWDEDAAHRKFVAFCAAMGALQEAGRRYRHVRETDPARAPEASRRINAVFAAALQTMDLARATRPARKSRLQWLALGLSLFLVGYALLSVLRAHPG